MIPKYYFQIKFGAALDTNKTLQDINSCTGRKKNDFIKEKYNNLSTYIYTYNSIFVYNYKLKSKGRIYDISIYE